MSALQQKLWLYHQGPRGRFAARRWIARVAPPAAGISHATLLASLLRFCRALRRVCRARNSPSPSQENHPARLRRHVPGRDHDHGRSRNLPGVLRGNADGPRFPHCCAERSAAAASGGIESDGTISLAFRKADQIANVGGQMKGSGGKGFWSSPTAFCGGLWRAERQN